MQATTTLAALLDHATPATIPSVQPDSATRAEKDHRWAEYQPRLLRWLAYRFREWGDAEEIADNALCLAWERFATRPLTMEDGRPAWLLHAYRAARWAAARASQGIQFVPTRKPGQRDCLDRRDADAAPLESVPCIDFGHAYVDRDELFERIGAIDPSMRILAGALTAGIEQAEIAGLFGVTERTIANRSDKLRVVVRDLLRADGR